MRELSIVILICSLGASAQAQPIPASEIDVEGLSDNQTDEPPSEPTFGESLCDLLWQEAVPIGPIRDASPQSTGPTGPIGPIRDTSPRSGGSPSGPPPATVALRDLIATPALARLPIELGGGLNAWERRIHLTLTEQRPLAFAADREIRLSVSDVHGEPMDFEAFSAPEADDRVCNQVRFAALANFEPGEYFVTVESDAPGVVGLVAAHLPAPPPIGPAPSQPILEIAEGAPGAVEEQIAQLANGKFELIETRPRPTNDSEGRDPPVAGNRSTVIIPCAYDARFVSFTPRSAPGGDQRGEFEFVFTVGENTPVVINDFGNSVGVDQTRFVHQSLGQILLPCNDIANVPVHLAGTEVDDWWIFGFVNPDEKANHAESMALNCGGGQTEFVQTYTMEFKAPSGTVRHTVDVEVAFRQENQAESCDEYDDPDELSPCTYDVALTSLEHVSSPAADKKGRFLVGGWIAEGFGQKYPSSDSQFIEVKRPETELLDLELATYTVPCGETYSIPLRVSASEDDMIGDDYGSLTQTIDLSCPPTSPLGHAVVTYPIDLEQDNGTVKHHIRVTARGKVTTQDFCEPAPVIAACVFGVDGYDVTHTDSPSADKKGEFSIGSDLGYGNDIQWNSYDVKLGDTSSSTWDQGTVSVPCGETVNAPLQIHAREYDIIDLWVSGWEIMMPHEYGGATVPLQFTCPPAVPSTAHSTHIVLRNGRGDREHEIDLGLSTRFDNPATACFPLQVPAPEPPPTSCQLEVDLWKFAHEDGSTGDKNARFKFEFEVDYLGSAHANGAGQDQGWHRIYRGNSKTIAEPIVFPDLGDPGTSHGAYFEVPVGATVPVSIRIDVTESDVFGDDKGWRETTLNLNCGMTAGPQDVVLPIKINDDKHLGVITLRVQEY